SGAGAYQTGGAFGAGLVSQASDHAERDVVVRRGEGAVDLGEVFLRELEVEGGGVVFHVFDVRRFRNREDVRVAREEVEDDLARRRIVALGDGVEDLRSRKLA